ncbi:hypothetical protein K435DRAFT_830508 [Dendrothele bispora CBS 962.96]|uniref:P/Homo B domain-containing protein n=1 Tax=Dendrothele bispora (strain CBS 962.96) TaxID=1314807 RepID=A0A4S8LHZ2_DENBC|nr:hypothetical protein K435DRAFT_830508 [Dendrothele bispora CBS 962.96]
MRCLSISLVLFLAYSAASTLSPTRRSYHSHDYYVIELDPHGSISLTDIADILEVEVVEQAGELANHWLVRAEKPELNPFRDSDRVLETFKTLQSRSSSLSLRSDDVARHFASSIKFLSKQRPRQRVKRAPPPISPADGNLARGIAERLGITDPLFKDQWHLVNEEFPEHMMNVTSVWEMGITGKGVISSLVDDGLDYTSLDLKDNFDATNSYDFNDHEDLPTPKLWDDHHGTRCAGQVAAGKNTACGLGIAYESKVAGVRILSGPITDVDEASALNYGYQDVSIYSCSWGPADNGESMEGPSQLIKKAVLNGINNGRGGKGSIFVFASGNGGAKGDQCNFDGYTNSIYSVTVAAVDHQGLHPPYSEACAANMVVAYSSGSGQHIVTTDKGEDKCTNSHGGTSAAAPNAVGVFALAMEVRPELTWRDIQHLCVETARMINSNDPDWEITAVGRPYSYKYGFGVLDAGLFVSAAKEWSLVKPQAWIETRTIQLNNGTMTEDYGYSGGHFISQGDGDNKGVMSAMTITSDMLQENNFESLEHINVRVWIGHKKRGDVEIVLISPNGVKSVLAGQRQADKDQNGFPGWTFMSVKHWGENPVGDWILHVSDQGIPGVNGSFLGWNMIFWGSSIDATKAKPYELPEEALVFPPPNDTPITDAPTITPTDQGVAPGENTNSTFSTSTPTPDEGYFSDLSNLLSSQKWFFVAIGLVIVFVVGISIFLWRRKAAQTKRRDYESLPENEETALRQTGGLSHQARSQGAGRTKELYDAFGEVSDDEDADEETHLTMGGRRMSDEHTLSSFHSGFLDDDDSEPPTPLNGNRGRLDASTSTSSLARNYRDDDVVSDDEKTTS